MPSQIHTCDLVRKFIEIKGWTCIEANEGDCKRFDIQHAQTTGIAKVYATGTLQIQGPTSELKRTLSGLKDLIECTQTPPETILLTEIKASVSQIPTRIPAVDPVVIQLLNESIACLESKSVYGCTILVGCASERAVWVLIESYTKAIADAVNRHRFETRMEGKFVSQAYRTFKQSLGSSKNKPAVDKIFHDWEAQIDALFIFYRICRNEVGHPIAPPNLDFGALVANLGQFAKYIEIIYGLINYFEHNNVVL